MPKIIAIDLDGTTLNQASLITEKTRHVLQTAQHAGHQVVIATGRPYRMSQQFYTQLGLTEPMLNLNGAIVHIPHQHWALEKHFLVKRDLAFEINAQKAEFGATFVACENKETFFLDNLSHYDAAFFAGTANENNLLTPQNLIGDPASIMLGTTPENLQPLAQRLQTLYGSDVDVRTWGGPFSILEMTAKGVQKALGLEYLSSVLNFKAQDVVAFGDEHNDVEMLAWAGWGVAMANGTPEAQKAANDVTTLANSQDGLAEYLLDYLKLRSILDEQAV